MDGLQLPYKIHKTEFLERSLRQQSSEHLGPRVQQHGWNCLCQCKRSPSSVILCLFCHTSVSHQIQAVHSKYCGLNCRLIHFQKWIFTTNLHSQVGFCWLIGIKWVVGRFKTPKSTAFLLFCIHLHWCGRQKLKKMFQCRGYFLLNGPLDW